MDFVLKLRKAEEGLENVNRDLIVHEAYRWVSNVELCRQILNGVNTIMIKKFTRLLSNFPVTNEMLHAGSNASSHSLTADHEMKVRLSKSFQIIIITLHLNVYITLATYIQADWVYICDMSEVMNVLTHLSSPCQQ